MKTNDSLKMLEFVLNNVEQTDEMVRLLEKFQRCVNKDERKIIVKEFEKEIDRAVGVKTGKFYVPENNN
jgi:uncharacterized protein Yka (UPF0111/DUF47 family)